MKSFFGSVVVAVVAAGACNPFAPDQSVVLDVTKLEAPATIAAGSPLTVVLTVTTGGCKTFDHIAVERETYAAALTPWGTDGAIGKKDVSCPTDIRETPHSIQLEPPFGSPFLVLVPRVGTDPLIATVQIP
ncbi:MAG: hypothetical protein DMD30_10940 [Gemmatimonadetes bacterium]|nr:MAG: hypothetical protein DMD30_10940 [Gemmatimonadota bacterium]